MRTWQGNGLEVVANSGQLGRQIVNSFIRDSRTVILGQGPGGH
jgi:hypothetical protein